MYSFSPGWYFKTSSESRLCNSMVAKGCLCSILMLFICYYLLFWAWNYLLSPGGKLRPALTFSNLWVPLARVFFNLWQSFIHNCCKDVYFGWIFSNRSIPPFPSVLPLPFVSFSVVFPCSLTTKTITSLGSASRLYLATPVVLHPARTLNCSPVPSWTYTF